MEKKNWRVKSQIKPCLGGGTYIVLNSVFFRVLTLALVGGISAQQAPAQSVNPPSLNLFGTPGLIDMPSAESQPDAQLSITAAHFAGTTRNTLTFQITPRLSGSFRYTKISDWHNPASPLYIPYGGATFDRSFDLQYRIFEERKYTPALSIGLRDFMGTGLYSSEYIVATKNLTPNVKLTGGLGWGRLSNSPTLHRGSVSTGGVPNYQNWFRGPVGAFGGLEWLTPLKGLTFKAEYSSDKYVQETVHRTIFTRKSPFNFGLEYTPQDNVHLGLYYLYGSTIGLRLSASMNPKRSPVNGSYEGAPLPITRRPDRADLSTDWLQIKDVDARVRDRMNKLLKKDGLSVEAVALSGTKIDLRIRNSLYNATPQALGRTARALAYVMPDSVETFVVTPVVDGIPVASVTFRRRDLEHHENHPDGTRLSFRAAGFDNAKPLPEHGQYARDLYPHLSWSLAPYLAISLFDPTAPVRANLGLRLEGQWDITPGLSFSGSLTKKIAGNLGQGFFEPSGLPRVRSDIGLYQEQGDPALERLTLDYLFKPAPALYGRISVGYLEQMYGGVSAELLWKPVDQNWGLGAEVNYVKQRDFNQRFGFQNYSIVTGHVSAYWDMKNGFSTQIDAGRYLAGDYGATISVNRRFDNGWRVGAYATFTNVPFSTFGEGSFDKGITLTVPLAWALGSPNRKNYSVVLKSLTRDGGARLDISNRLYPMVQDYHGTHMTATWGRFWR